MKFSLPSALYSALVFGSCLIGCSIPESDEEAPRQLASAEQKAVTAVKLMVVGDSISQGHEGDFTWRYRLYQHLTGLGISARFVGPWTGTARLGPPTTGTTPARHDGEYRRGIDFPQPANLAEWGWMMGEAKWAIAEQMRAYTPEVLLVELGFNDIAWNLSDTPIDQIAAGVHQSLRELVRNARNVSANIKILVADAPQRTPIDGYEILPSKIAAYNNKLDEVLRGLNAERTASPPVYRVYFDLLFNEYGDAYDGLHPNVRGEYVIAKAFADELAKKFGIGATMPVPSSFPPDLEPEAVPWVEARLNDDYSATLSWPHVFAAGGYWIWTRNVTKDGPTSPFKQLPFPIAADGWRPTLLPAGQTQEFMVQTMRGNYSAGNSRIVSVTAPALQPVQITSYGPGPRLASATLSWKPVPNADDYHIYASGQDCTSTQPSTEGFQLVQWSLGDKMTWTQDYIRDECINYYVVASRNGGEGPRPATALRVWLNRLPEFFTYNVSGADGDFNHDSMLLQLIDWVRRRRPVAFALQEVCSSQADQISSQLRALGIPYVQAFQNLAWAGVNPSCPSAERQGNVIFHAGTTLGQTSTQQFTSRSRFLRGVICARVPANARPNQPRSFYACSTHLDTDDDTRRLQADELTTHMNGLIAAGNAVVLGGDFNVVPLGPELDGLFLSSYTRGTGFFTEANVPSNRISDDKTSDSHGKIDYNFVAGIYADALAAQKTGFSDHYLTPVSLIWF